MKKRKSCKIIFIVADALRFGSLGIYGRKPTPTPNLDHMANRGVVFDQAYATITKTDPSITAMMSGLYPVSLGLIKHANWRDKKQEEGLKRYNLLPEILEKEGYYTAAVDWFGRWHKRGYSYYSGKILKDYEATPLVHKKMPFLRYATLLDTAAVKLCRRDFFSRFYYCFFPQPRVPYDPADIVVNRALKLLNKNEEKPLFLYLHLWDTHFPHIRPKGLGGYLFSGLEARYQAEVNFLDAQLGRLLDYLSPSIERGKTLVIFTADHGESLFEHGIPLAHRGLYEEVVRVPLIILGGSFSSGKIKALVQHVDLFPTILDWLEIPMPYKVDGSSLLPLITGKRKKIRDFVYFEDISFGEMAIKKSSRKRGLRQDNWKYIQTLRGKNDQLFSVFPGSQAKLKQEELYRLSKDPLEKKNLFEKKTKETQRLRETLENYLTRLKKQRKKFTTGDKKAKLSLNQEEQKALESRLERLGYF